MAEQATQQAQEKTQPPAATMSEAGFSMNVKMVDEHGQEVMLTFRCPRASDSAKLINHYSQTIADLLRSGWQVLRPGVRAEAPQQDAPANGGAVPTCRVHGAQMKPSRKPGSFYCSKKLADGSYCSEKVDAV